MVTWKDEYKIGIEFIDDQHKMLFDIAGKVYALIQDTLRVDKYDDIVSLVNELRDYTAFHFEAEEKYMEKIGFKKAFTQKIEHNDFNEKFANINFDHLDHKQEEFLNELMDFVLNWLSEHILEKDILIAEFVKENKL